MPFDPAELTAAHLRAARQLLGWHAADLADHARVGIATIRRAELCEGVTDMRPDTAAKVLRALEKAGVVFFGKDRSGGIGVRLRR